MSTQVYTKATTASDIIALMQQPVEHLPAQFTKHERQRIHVYYHHICDLAATRGEIFNNSSSQGLAAATRRKIRLAMMELGISFVDVRAPEQSTYAFIAKYGAVCNIPVYNIVPLQMFKDGFHLDPRFYLYDSRSTDTSLIWMPYELTIGEFTQLSPWSPSDEQVPYTEEGRYPKSYPTPAFRSYVLALKAKLEAAAAL